MKIVKKVAAFLVAIATVTCIVGCSGTAKSEQAKKEKTEPEQVELEVADSWPTTSLAKLIEQPDFGVLEVGLDSANVLMLDFDNVKKSDYNAYVESCMEKFSVDYYKTSTYYRAENEDGYGITISYDEDDKGSMSVRVYTPNEEDTTTDDVANEDDATTEESTDDVVDVIETEEEIQEAEDSKETEDNSSKEVVDNSTSINPDLKEFLDSYEKFVDEYCVFMEKYYKADAAEMLSLVVDYTKYCERLIELEEKLNDYDASTMTRAEALYYSEVMLRCSEKMQKVIQ